MSQLIKVGMADYKFSKSPDRLITYGLGSCVGIVLYDKSTKIGGMAHIMLPDSLAMNQASNVAKFADTALAALISDLYKAGVKKGALVAKIAGGAQMFAFTGGSDAMRIGEKNTIAVKKILNELGVKLIGEDTGGNVGRTVELDLATGDFLIRTIRKGQSSI